MIKGIFKQDKWENKKSKFLFLKGQEFKKEIIIVAFDVKNRLPVIRSADIP